MARTQKNKVSKHSSTRFVVLQTPCKLERCQACQACGMELHARHSMSLNEVCPVLICRPPNTI